MSLLYAAGAVFLTRRWLQKSGSPPLRADFVPLRILKPATGWDARLIHRLAGWREQAAPGDRVEILTDSLPNTWAGQAAERLGEALIPLPPQNEKAINPKVSRLAQHAPSENESPDWWVIADQEVVATPALFATLRECAAQGEGVWSFPYRFEGCGLPLLLDRASFHLCQWPGLAWLRGCGKLALCLGAVMLVPAGVVARLGGFAALRGWLAEDYQLEKKAAALGVPVHLTNHVVVLEAEPMNGIDWWRHQRRMSMTFACNQPAGYAASVLVMTGAWWWLAWLASAPWGWLAGALVARVALVRLSAELFGERQPWALSLAAVPALLCEPLFYLFAWVGGRRVFWRGRWLRLGLGGTIDAGEEEVLKS